MSESLPGISGLSSGMDGRNECVLTKYRNYVGETYSSIIVQIIHRVELCLRPHVHRQYPGNDARPENRRPSAAALSISPSL